MQLVHSTISTLKATPIKKDSAQSIRVEKWMRVQYQKQYDEGVAKYADRIKAIQIYEPNFRLDLQGI